MCLPNFRVKANLKKSVHIVHESTALTNNKLINTSDSMCANLGTMMLKVAKELGHEYFEPGLIELIVRVLTYLL